MKILYYEDLELYGIIYKEFYVGGSKQKAVLYVPYITAKHPTVLYCVVIEPEIDKQLERLQSLEAISLQTKGIVSSLRLLDILLTVL